MALLRGWCDLAADTLLVTLPEHIHPHDVEWARAILDGMPAAWTSRAIDLYDRAFTDALASAEGTDMHRASVARRTANLLLLDIQERASAVRTVR